MKKILTCFLLIFIASSIANAMNEYSLIVEGEEEGGDEYPSIYLEEKSLNNIDGIVTATTFEKYELYGSYESSLGYKTKIQINCKNKTYKFLDVVWLGNPDLDMNVDYIGETFNINSGSKGSLMIHKLYCK